MSNSVSIRLPISVPPEPTSPDAFFLGGRSKQTRLARESGGGKVEEKLYTLLVLLQPLKKRGSIQVLTYCIGYDLLNTKGESLLF